MDSEVSHQLTLAESIKSKSSTYLFFERLLAVRSSLTKVLQELEWDDLATSEWKSLEAVWNLQHPFAQFTSLIQGEEYTTISAVIPSIMDLNLHLQEMSWHSDVCVSRQRSCNQSSKRRFKKYTDPNDSCFEHLFWTPVFVSNCTWSKVSTFAKRLMLSLNYSRRSKLFQIQLTKSLTQAKSWLCSSLY